ncbi:7975_t:CDS:2 [Entrophospora sp. SA101]|nr:7975_t:CDS:2 [Entrophospora sp. SA101]
MSYSFLLSACCQRTFVTIGIQAGPQFTINILYGIYLDLERSAFYFRSRESVIGSVNLYEHNGISL